MKLRLIEKDEKHIIKDIKLELNIELSALERPAYVEFSEMSSSVFYDFIYSNSTEDTDDIWISVGDVKDAIFMQIGKHSGRIIYGYMYKIDRQLILKVKPEDYLNSSKSKRYNTNIVNSINLFKELITYDFKFAPIRSQLANIIKNIDEAMKNIAVLNDADEINSTIIKESTTDITDSLYKMLSESREKLTEEMNEYNT